MNDPFEPGNNPRPPVQSGGFDFNQPTIVSLLYIASFVVGITGLVGIVLAHIWSSDAPQEWEKSHYAYLIRTFWFGLLGGVIGVVLSFVLIGIPILIAVAVWVLVRSIVSLLKAQRHEPMPNPETLGI